MDHGVFAALSVSTGCSQVRRPDLFRLLPGRPRPKTDDFRYGGVTRSGLLVAITDDPRGPRPGLVDELGD